MHMDIEQPTAIPRLQPTIAGTRSTCLPYKEDGAAPFKAISRQVLFAEAKLGCELRYFEMAAGGYSTLERHEHMHAVMILRGRGHAWSATRCGESSRSTWSPSRPGPGTSSAPPRASRSGFLCMVNALRDKPQLPTEQELAALKANHMIAAFLAR